jgi:hypothetical protein
MKDKKKVLFICTHNSARSHMAEGFMNAFLGDHYEAWSAGTDPSVVNPTAVKVMAEVGIDLSAHHSKGLDGFLDREEPRASARGFFKEKAISNFMLSVLKHLRPFLPTLPTGA